MQTVALKLTNTHSIPHPYRRVLEQDIDSASPGWRALNSDLPVEVERKEFSTRDE